MEKHFVTFYSPGIFVSEETTKPVDAWGVDTAVEMAHAIEERYGARPYGFRFSTRARNDDELGSRVVRRSGLYWLGGKVDHGDTFGADCLFRVPNHHRTHVVVR